MAKTLLLDGKNLCILYYLADIIISTINVIRSGILAQSTELYNFPENMAKINCYYMIL